MLDEIGKPLSIREMPLPEIREDEVLVETRACGICGTDLHILSGFAYVPKLPHIPGHEPSGVVAQVGSSVKRIQKGDRVVPHLFITCGRCWYCRSGRDSMCSDLAGIIGVTVDGAFAQYFKAPEENLFKLPETIPFEKGALIADAVVTSVHAVHDRSNVKSGDVAAVIGVGGVGQVIVQLLKHMGASVIAISRSDQKLSIARRLGAETTIKAGLPDIASRLRKSSPDGVDCVFDCVGSRDSMKDAIAAVRRCGRIVMIGEEKDLLPADTIWIAQHELEVVGSRNGTRANMAKAVDLVRQGVVTPYVSNRFSLEEINEAMRTVKEGTAGRVVINVH